jgi:SAM-dependent methyltransferase
VAERSGPYLGHVFNEVPELYERVRPAYPDALFLDLATIADLTAASDVLEVGSGTGQATRSLAPLVRSVTAVEPGAGMVAVARERLARVDNVEFETSTFEQWDARGRRFDAIVAASSWHWVDPSIGWRRAHDLLRPGGWMALAGNVVVRRPGDVEVYAATADIHQRYSPDNPDWGDPPLEEKVLATGAGWGLVADPGPLFGSTVVRWYPTAQTFDGAGFADLLRTLSPYRRLASEVREALLSGVAERIRNRMDDVARRRYLSVLRMGQRSESDPPHPGHAREHQNAREDSGTAQHHQSWVRLDHAEEPEAGQLSEDEQPGADGDAQQVVGPIGRPHRRDDLEEERGRERGAQPDAAVADAGRGESEGPAGHGQGRAARNTL